MKGFVKEILKLQKLSSTKQITQPRKHKYKKNGGDKNKLQNHLKFFGVIFDIQTKETNSLIQKKLKKQNYNIISLQGSNHDFQNSV